jgi:hypothetical protein
LATRTVEQLASGDLNLPQRLISQVVEQQETVAVAPETFVIEAEQRMKERPASVH